MTIVNSSGRGKQIINDVCAMNYCCFDFDKAFPVAAAIARENRHASTAHWTLFDG